MLHTENQGLWTGTNARGGGGELITRTRLVYRFISNHGLDAS